MSNVDGAPEIDRTPSIAPPPIPDPELREDGLPHILVRVPGFTLHGGHFGPQPILYYRAIRGFVVERERIERGAAIYTNDQPADIPTALQVWEIEREARVAWLNSKRYLAWLAGRQWKYCCGADGCRNYSDYGPTGHAVGWRCPDHSVTAKRRTRSDKRYATNAERQAAYRQRAMKAERETAPARGGLQPNRSAFLQAAEYSATRG